MNLDDQIKESIDIYNRAVAEFKPSAVAVMLSGGDDSLTVLFLALKLKLPIDIIIHGNTGTGLPEATDFVRAVAASTGIKYVEADAGDAFEKYVRRKGFFGKGRTAHSYAYHVLKAAGFRTAISRHLRKRKRNYKVLCLNGVRIEESDNRADNYADEVWRVDRATKNDVWVNLIHYWTHEECLEFLEAEGIKRSPVAEALGRSGECMCGTMQTMANRMEAAKFSPKWGKWIDELEREVVKDFPWRWSQNMPKGWKKDQAVQGSLFKDFTPDFQPACAGCKARMNNCDI
jgi:3'-phosphoadenosine 5'-phosphosulfate sulfotransferase (PAPS reductase)/FAD synthetase